MFQKPGPVDEVIQKPENALNMIWHTTDQNGNMRKELNKTVFETLSNLINIFNKMIVMNDEKTRQKKQMEKEIRTVK
jgi:hypothetical protein